MNMLSSILKGVGAGLATGSFAGGFTAATTNSFWAGMGVGVADNLSFGSISAAMTGQWNNNYSYGNFYSNNLDLGIGSRGFGMDYYGADMYSNYSNYFGNNNNWFDTNLNF